MFNSPNVELTGENDVVNTTTLKLSTESSGDSQSAITTKALAETIPPTRRKESNNRVVLSVVYTL